MPIRISLKAPGKGWTLTLPTWTILHGGRLLEDAENLELLELMIADITPDTFSSRALKLISDKIENPLNPGIKDTHFSAFADTVNYHHNEVAPYVKARYGLDTAMVTGTANGKTTVKRRRTDINTILTLFSPVSKTSLF